jgi:hypothetical protein
MVTPKIYRAKYRTIYLEKWFRCQAAAIFLLMPKNKPSRYSLHPGIARMGSAAEIASYPADAIEFVEGMYSGSRAALRPVHDALETLALSLGPDIRLCPGKTIVPIYRKHVIAQIKPASKNRIDFGLALGKLSGKGRLIDTGGYEKKDRITHRIAVASLADIDAELTDWLRRAYQRDGD